MYYVVYGVLYLLSLLPLRVLYLFSDFLYFMIYYVVGYRKDVVRNNLLLVFSGKTEKERKHIEKKFYRNFMDSFIETVKLISAPSSFLQKHFTGDFSLCNKVYDEGRKCQLLVAHNFNWEMAMQKLPLGSKHKILIVYYKLSSKIFDRLIFTIRTKTGAIMLPANEMRESIAPYRDSLYMLLLGADQNSGDPSKAYWFHFFGKPTPFVKGPERAARKENIPVIFCKFLKKKRGHYEVIFEMGAEDPATLPEFELTKKYVSFLEDFISQHPEMWLWSHRRWRHEWKEEYDPVIG